MKNKDSIKKMIVVLAGCITIVAILGICLYCRRIYFRTQEILASVRGGNDATVSQETSDPVAEEVEITEVAPVETEVAEGPVDGRAVLDNLVNQKIEKQKQVEENIINELKLGDYDFNNPLVVLNPYEISPLTALICFKADGMEQVSLELLNKGQIEADDISATFVGEAYDDMHVIPVYGLYANTENIIELTGTDKNGNSTSTQISITTGELNTNLKNTLLICDLMDKDAYQSGFNFSYDGLNEEPFKKAFDSDGNIRWYTNETFTPVSIMSDGKGHMYHFIQYEGYEVMYEIDYLGRIYSVYFDTEWTHHDAIVLNDTIIMTKSEFAEEEPIEDLLTKVDLKTGKVLEKIDYKELMPKSRIVSIMPDQRDWCHMNSVVEQDGDVIVSSNIQSAIMRNSWDGEIKWILSNPKGWYPQWEKYLLKPVGSDFEYTYNQHAVEVLPDYDNNPDTIDIIVFDNGHTRNIAENKDDVTSPLYSRLVQYRINEKEMTVEQIWQFGKEHPELFSRFRGDANLMSGGTILGTFPQESEDSEMKDTVYIEVTKDGNIVWECYAGDRTCNNLYQDYKCERIEMYAYPGYVKLGQDVPVINITNEE